MNLWFAAARTAALVFGGSLLALTTSEPAGSEIVASFSRPPNYSLTRDSGDQRQLFDGHLASGVIWTSRDTVGWAADQRPITIRADLGQMRPTDRICLHTARRKEAGVSYPVRIDVFTSTDGTRFGWRGDAVDGEAQDGPYEARWFCTEALERRVRFVTIVVRTRGGYFFADEVEVRPMPADKPAANSGQDVIPAAEVESFALEKQALIAAASDLAASRTPEEQTSDDLIGQAGRAARDASSPASLEHVKAMLYRACPGASAGANVSILRITPYGDFSPFCAGGMDGNPVVRLAPGWHRAVSLWIFNGGNRPATVRLTAALDGFAASGINVRLFDVRSVLAAPALLVADPLMPLTGNGVTVPAGEGRRIWVDIRATPGGQSGDAVLTIAAPNAPSLAVPIQVIGLPDGPVPTTTVWGYLDALPIRARPADAVRDMLEHGVTSAVLPSSDMPWPTRANGPSIGDYGRFDAAMAARKGHASFLFYMGLNDPSKAAAGLGSALFSPAWQDRFVEWIREWSDRLVRSGLNYDEFAMYPVDEPGTETIRDRLVLLSRLIKSADPRIRVYSTLHRPEMLTDELVRAVDIFQLNGAALTPETVARLQQAGKTVWSYKTDGGGKAADPARFYRSQGWKAFLLGLNGFGFWSYADAGRTGTVWNDFDDVRPDFAVVYDSPDGIISSRRWEAWREGVQDYRLLASAYRAAHDPAGKRRVRQLAEQGFQSLGNSAQLDRVIAELLQIASGKSLNSTDRSAMSEATRGRAEHN
jgi:hypothetical protein